MNGAARLGLVFFLRSVVRGDAVFLIDVFPLMIGAPLLAHV